MIIGAIGYNYQHREKFVMERPNGTGCRLLLIVKEPSLFVINGEEYHVKKNSFVLFSPTAAYRYCGEGEVYTDDWIYFNTDPEDEERLRELGIPSDEVMYLGRTDELSQLIQFMTYEHYSAEPGHDEIERLYSEILLLKLSRLITVQHAHSQVIADKNNRFVQLRSRLYSMPEDVADVSQLAEESGMSRSGFQHTYKRIFGVSARTDIINARMERAKSLLISTSLPVMEIAFKCGYSSEYSFMRQFKNHFGKTPTEFRSIL
ncbi:MAG: helix-turn-helix domain-containing protein [Oscillospiraceae bacterium]